MPNLDLSGRILFLSDDPAIVEAQLAGRELGLAEALPLRDNISTDEITPIVVMNAFDERLGNFPYVGFKAGDAKPITPKSVRQGGFSVTVGGKRYGKGSSREHSVVAEKSAGIRLVIAESFERIYRQNADNVGLFTSTDMGLIDRIARGDAIDVEELVADRDELSAAILREGGLLQYGARHMRTVSGLTREEVLVADRPRTFAEKILARHMMKTDQTSGEIVDGHGAFVRADWRFIIEFYTAMAAHMMHQTFGRSLTLKDPETIVGFAEHFSYTHRSPAHMQGGLLEGIRTLHEGHEAFIREYGLRNHGFLREEEGSDGICHPIMAESYALPGQVVVGTDSHTPHSGAVGCLAFGVGTTEMANAMLTGAVRITVPETIRVNFEGAIPDGVTSKDLVLTLLAHPSIRAGGGLGRVFEFGGSGIAALSTDARATLTNMAAELGGFTGLVVPDEETIRFIKERRGFDAHLEPWMKSDEGASYADTIDIDCTSLSPMVASPGDPGQGVPVASLDHAVPIDIAYGGSCTGGKREDFDDYHRVARWAVENGLTVPSDVKLYLQFGTNAVRDYCVEQGYLADFEKIGAELLMPACGACANLGPGSSDNPAQVTVSAQNRNFPGRSGPGQIWLASPPTVIASAIQGKLASFAELKSTPTATA
jgi:3-isopropylmalate/(R)-2-methylmalate dehydratase large subunit